MRKQSSSPHAIMKRLDSVEKVLREHAGMSGEIEDMRETEISVYGLPAIEEIEEREGRGALMELLHSPEISDEIKVQIADYIR